jgi:hypothetical protein
MTRYTSLSGKQGGVTAYEISNDFIIVEFYTKQYKYSYSSCGKKATDIMKSLALASKGLSTFISKNKPSFEWKH